MSDNSWAEEINKFVRRLKKIGIDVKFIGNYPWIYLETVNGKKVEGKFHSNYGFTVFWSGIKYGDVAHISDITEVFKKIRETLKQQ